MKKNIKTVLDEAEGRIKKIGTRLEEIDRLTASSLLQCVAVDFDNERFLPTEAAINTFAPILHSLGHIDLLNDYEKELVCQAACEFLHGRGYLRNTRDLPDPEEGDNFYSDKDLLVQITNDGEHLDFSETAGNSYQIKLDSIASIEYEKNVPPLNTAVGKLIIRDSEGVCSFRFCVVSEKVAMAVARLAKRQLIVKADKSAST